jgi:hypothetical protein
MAREKSYERIDPVYFTADGQENGIITVESVECFKVKMVVQIYAKGVSTENGARFMVKRVLNETQMLIGPYDKPALHLKTDMRAYTVANEAFVEFAPTDRPDIPMEDYERAVYEEEPVVAKRVISVDKLGNTFGKSHQGQQQFIEGSITGSVYNNLKLAYNNTLQVEYIAESPFATLDSENGHFIQKVVYDAVLNATRILLGTSENSNSEIRNITITPTVVAGVNYATILCNTGEFKELEDPDKYGSLKDGMKADDQLMDITINTSLGLDQTFSGKIIQNISNQEVVMQVLSGTAVSETTDVTQGDIITKTNGEYSSLLQRRWDLREDYIYRVREDE